MTKKTLYTLVFLALSIIAVTGIYYLSRTSSCCSCQIISTSFENPIAADHESSPETNAEQLTVETEE